MTTETHEEHRTPGPGEVVPAPADFPVRWQQSGDERLFWLHDKMHFPDPLMPLTESLFVDLVFEDGWNYAGTRLEFPIRFRAMAQNGIVYEAVVPKGSTADEMAALGRKAEETLRAVMPVQIERWNDQFFPEIKEHIAALEGMDLEHATAEQLLQYVDETIARTKRIWEIHFMVALPSMPPMSMFQDLYTDLFGPEDELVAYTLLRGNLDKITETGLAIWRLGRTALAIPAVRRAIEEKSPDEVIPALEESEEGRRFLVDLRDYLDEYGKRSSSALAFDEVSWIEDPTPVIVMLKDAVGQPDRDLEAEYRTAAAEGARAIEEARDRLATYPLQVRDHFEQMLDFARQGMFMAEQHNFYIDYNAMYEVRLVFLAVGRHFLHAGRLDDISEVFYLTLEDIRSGLRGGGGDLRAMVAERASDHARRSVMHPPPALGTMPADPPPSDPLSTAARRFGGGPPEMATEPDSVKGAPGSPGRVRGVARVLRGMRDAGRLGTGEIIVAEATATPWTPLFATAGGIVTDTGGVLSHAAVAAREYGIPAVVGAAFATATIRDGQTIEVDGSTGIVRLVADE